MISDYSVVESSPVDISSTADSSSSLSRYDNDELTTDEMLHSIEYHTRMTSQGISHIFAISIFLLGAAAAWVVIKRWYFGGV